MDKYKGFAARLARAGWMAPSLASVSVRGYTNGMKTAVSIPDRVFEATEKLAQTIGKSRSEVYSLALAEYVARHAPEYVTETFDRVCSEVGEGTDEFVSAAARRLLERSQW